MPGLKGTLSVGPFQLFHSILTSVILLCGDCGAPAEEMTVIDNIVEDTMVVDPKHHRFFVARRGEVLRKIGEEFGGVGQVRI